MKKSNERVECKNVHSLRIICIEIEEHQPMVKVPLTGLDYAEIPN